MKTLTLDGVEFARRWLQHVLPRGFVATRPYGLLANQNRADKLALCRRLLGEATTERAGDDATPNRDEVPHPFAARCPKCGGAMVLVCELVPIILRALPACNCS